MSHRSLILPALMIGLCAIGAEPVLKPGDRILFAGDSITMNGEGQWCPMIAQALRDADRWQDYDLRVVANSGQTVNSWRGTEKKAREQTVTWRIPGGTVDVGQTLDDGADILIIMLGMNDVLSPQVKDDDASIAKWRESYTELITTLRERVKPRAIGIATPTPCTEDPAGPKNQVMDRLVEQIRAIADAEGCFVLPTRATSWQVLASARRHDPAARLTGDQIHPGKLGAIAIAAGMLRGLGETDAADAYLSAKLPTPETYLSYAIHPMPTAGDAPGIAYEATVWHLTGAFSLSTPAGWTAERIARDPAYYALSGSHDRLVAPFMLRAGKLHRQLDIPAPWLVGYAPTNRKGWGHGSTDFDPDAGRLPVDAAIRTGHGLTPAALAAMTVPGDHPIHWRQLTNTIDYAGRGSPFTVDFMQHSYFWSGGTGYGIRWLHVDADTPLTLRISDGSGFAHLEVWLNGDTLYLGAAKAIDKAGYPITLKAGWNLLSFKSNYLYGPWNHTFTLLDADGQDVTDIGTRILPPTD